MKKNYSKERSDKPARLSIWKFFSLILLLSIPNARAANTQDYLNRKLTISCQNREVKKILLDIEKQTGVRFVYSSNVIHKGLTASLNAERQALDDVLEKLLSPLNVNYEVSGRNIILSPGKGPESSVTLQETTQQIVRSIKRTITGEVTDEKGVALPGVNILVKGTQRGTSSDVEGKFRLDLEDGDNILLFSFVGYQTKEVHVGNESRIAVSLTPEDKALEEVVVTALGIKKSAKSLGYATATVPTEEMTVNRTANFMNALQGKMAGVNITSMGTGPAGTSKIRIRGQSSFGGNNSPLIVVNGVPIDNSNFGAKGDQGDRGSNRTSDSGDGLASINP